MFCFSQSLCRACIRRQLLRSVGSASPFFASCTSISFHICLRKIKGLQPRKAVHLSSLDALCTCPRIRGKALRTIHTSKRKVNCFFLVHILSPYFNLNANFCCARSRRGTKKYYFLRFLCLSTLCALVLLCSRAQIHNKPPFSPCTLFSFLNPSSSHTYVLIRTAELSVP